MSSITDVVLVAAKIFVAHLSGLLNFLLSFAWQGQSFLELATELGRFWLDGRYSWLLYSELQVCVAMMIDVDTFTRREVQTSAPEISRRSEFRLATPSNAESPIFFSSHRLVLLEWKLDRMWNTMVSLFNSTKLPTYFGPSYLSIRSELWETWSAAAMQCPLSYVRR